MRPLINAISSLLGFQRGLNDRQPLLLMPENLPNGTQNGQGKRDKNPKHPLEDIKPSVARFPEIADLLPRGLFQVVDLLLEGFLPRSKLGEALYNLSITHPGCYVNGKNIQSRHEKKPHQKGDTHGHFTNRWTAMIPHGHHSMACPTHSQRLPDHPHEAQVMVKNLSSPWSRIAEDSMPQK